MKLRFRQPAQAERVASSDPFSLFDVTAEALSRRAGASYDPTNMFPGFVTSYVDGRLSIRKDYTPAVGEQVSLGQSPEGTWTIEHKTWRPGTEHEAHGASIFHTSTRPVSPAETGTRETEVCYRNQNGTVTLVEVADVALLEPMTGEQCAGYTRTFQDFLDSARG